MKTLHLVLKSKWYDKIASGEKTSEYRECKPYWNRRFCGYDAVVGTQNTRVGFNGNIFLITKQENE